MILDYPHGPNIITRVVKTGRRRQEKSQCLSAVKWERLDDTLLALKMEQVATSQAMPVAFRSQKRMYFCFI